MKNIKNLTAASVAALSLAPIAANAQTYSTTYTTSTADTAAGAGLAIGSMIFLGILSIVGLVLFIFWILMLVDVFKRTNWKQPNDKTIWIVVVILLGYLGAIIYYFAVKRSLDKASKSGMQGPSNPMPPQSNVPPSNTPPTSGNTPPPAAPQQ
jgi:hypothetical protein